MTSSVLIKSWQSSIILTLTRMLMLLKNLKRLMKPRLLLEILKSASIMISLALQTMLVLTKVLVLIQEILAVILILMMFLKTCFQVLASTQAGAEKARISAAGIWVTKLRFLLKKFLAVLQKKLSLTSLMLVKNVVAKALKKAL